MTQIIAVRFDELDDAIDELDQVIDELKKEK